MSDNSQSSLKKFGRGMAQASLDLIEAMRVIAREIQPVTGRGVGYKLFTAGLIPSMSTNDMQRVYRLLKLAREDEIIPWHWIVDETRSIERVSTWDNPEQYARCVARSYRRDFWNQQPYRVTVLSEKGTIRGVVGPVLDEYAVGFFPLHGFSSATAAHDLAEDDDGRTLILLYIGDYDPSGLYMSEVDLPNRFEKYGGNHIELRRIALTIEQCRNLPSFPASDKQTDKRYEWFCDNCDRWGEEARCWELDAMDPRDLRNCVEHEICMLIDWDEWKRCDRINKAEQESMRTILANWHPPEVD
jgi:hypothetical protein